MNQEQFFLSKVNILVVDDTIVNLTLLSQILSSSGYKVRVAPNGKLALQSARSNPPDLILLDIKMPEMNGYEVCQHLKEDQRTCEIPVIFISALDEAVNQVTAFSVGGVDYITKPFEEIEVLARIENQLRLRKFQLELQIQNAQLQLLLTTTQAISSAANVEEALEVILTNLCSTIGWDFGEAWIPNSETSLLEYSRTWYASKSYLNQFYRQSCNLRFASGEGFPGRVWLSQKLEWIKDVSQAEEGVFYRVQMAREAGLKGAIAIPIAFENQVLAVLVFFQRQQMIPDEKVLTLVNAIATQLGSMIHRKKIEADLIRANLELERLANLDGLTKVANRRRFDTYLAEEWQRVIREKQPISLILFDVDYFKKYNDYYGHQCGDECLQKIALAASCAAKRSADLVARYGGEEFAIILPNTPAEGAIQVAQEIREQMSLLKLPHITSDVNEYVTLSLGVCSIIPTRDDWPESLIAAADKALYQAKTQGRDRIIFQTTDLSTSPVHST